MSPELEALIEESKRRVAAMTPDERKAMIEEQGASLARAEMLARAEAERSEAGMQIGPYSLRVLQASGGSNIVGAHVLVRDLYDKAKTLVDILDDREKNHGALIGPETLNARNELALELSRWTR